MHLTKIGLTEQYANSPLLRGVGDVYKRVFLGEKIYKKLTKINNKFTIIIFKIILRDVSEY